MFVPPLSQDYVSLNSFVSNNYGVSINRADGKVTWSARRANGKQTCTTAWC